MARAGSTVLTVATACLVLAAVATAQDAPTDESSSRFPQQMTPCRVGIATGVCGSFSVAENRDLDDGRRIDLFTAIVPATSADRLPDPIVVLEGGPGASVVHFAGLHVQTFASLTGRRDLVLVDQRGTGRSAPLDCDLTKDLTELANPARTRDCRELLEGQADLTRYTTTDAVDDLVEILDWLGYRQVNLFGVSNGTRTALHLARRHPERIRTLALIAPYPFSHNVLTEGSATLDRTLDLLAADCAADAECAEAFPDLSNSIETLKGGPPPPEVDWPLLTAMLRMMLFFPLPTSQVPNIIDGVAAGCQPPRPAATDSQLAGWISEGAFLSILCAEDASRTDLESVRQASMGSFLGDGWAKSLLESCAEWPQRPLPEDFESPITIDIPALLLVGRLDPAMPPEWSRELARQMSRALVVEVPEGQHSFVGMSGAGCLLGLLQRFIEDGSAERLDPSCVGEMRRPPFVIPDGQRPQSQPNRRDTGAGSPPDAARGGASPARSAGDS